MNPTAKFQMSHFCRISLPKNGIQFHRTGQASRFTKYPVKDQAQKIFAYKPQPADFPQMPQNVSLSEREEEERIQKLAEDAMSCEYFVGTIDR